MGVRGLFYENRELWWATQRLEREVYNRWQAMWQRCTNARASNYADYGGRGIVVCERWRIFYNFWSDMGHPPTPLHTIERVNNALGYSPENCIWADRVVQANNQRVRSTNVSGVTGVCRYKDNYWRAVVVVKGKQIHLYNGPSLEKAIEARLAWNTARYRR